MTICNIKEYQVVFDKYKNKKKLNCFVKIGFCCPLIQSLIFYIVFWRLHNFL